MIRINLLPFRAARKKENIRRQVSVFLLSIVFSSLALYNYHSLLNEQIETLSSQAKTVKANLQTKQKAAKEVDSIKKELDLLKIKMEGIKLIKLRRKEPVQLLESMTEVIIEKRMWFTRFTANNQSVGISGIALDQKTVADFMTRLENVGLFSSVNLSMLRQTTMDKLNLKSFEIVCDKKKINKPVKGKDKKK
jgi:type IV pilus assembly protein PilN